ncbi:N-terminal asparagine [Seminavis robusta]|uniref:N-terminal asparagine n=1 Tax=Seminavis robusta TaxID=568900 RepID=A0A9N8E4M6_9STRA|nr:N-terminal asparagine [Seminavis robusta]|eukprot:Sro516_g158490.1 N-terminal asparagine (409) ;mRNA; r:24466-25692
MVLATIHPSDSCGTLVSLDNGSKPLLHESDFCHGCSPSSVVAYRQTALKLASDDSGLDLSSASSSSSSSSMDNSYSFCSCEQQQQPEKVLFLPAAQSDTPVDEFLPSVPELRDSRDELLAVDPVQFHKASSEKLLYVHQGEVAHALASQCDILVSDRATTCHILALRSVGDKPAMTSLTHIDSDQYETCIRAMIQEHKLHHSSKEAITMEINIVGGFADEEGHSQKISNWLLHLLADIAEEETDSIEMRLKTCAISSMNDSGFQCPIGRGLAIHLATGQVFLAKASSAVAGPHMILRNARLWSSTEEEHPASKLTVIHTAKSNEIVIEPFAFAAIPGMDRLMALPDDILLEYTSTSPCAEEDDFCPTVRSTLRFLLEVPHANVFGRLCDRTLRFVRRCHNSNEWMLVA